MAVDPAPSPVPCVCGSNEYRHLLRGVFTRRPDIAAVFPFEVRRCRRCGLDRTFPVPPLSYYAMGDNPMMRVDAPPEEWSDHWSEGVAAWVHSTCPSGPLLDVGCGMGNLVDALNRLGRVAVGFDHDSQAVALGRERGRELYAGQFGTVGHCGPFAGIVMNHVLEHIHEPGALLRQFRDLLDSGGLVCICVPGHRGLVPRLMGDRWEFWAPAEHVWHFRRPTLVSLLRGAGFEPVRVTQRGALESPRGTSPLRSLLKRGLMTVAGRLQLGDQIEAVFRPGSAMGASPGGLIPCARA